MKSAREIMATTGGYLNASNALAIPGVAAVYGELLQKVQALPFVPAGWISDVRQAMTDAGPSSTWMPRHAIQSSAFKAGKTAPLLEDIPAWLSGDAQAATAWNKLTDWWSDRIMPILAGYGRDQAAIMQSANRDASFWNGLYAIVKPVANVGDAIIAAPEKVGEVVSKSFMGALRGFAPVLIVGALIGAGFLVYKSGLYKKWMK